MDIEFTWKLHGIDESIEYLGKLCLSILEQSMRTTYIALMNKGSNIFI